MARRLLLPVALLLMGMAPHSTSVTRWAFVVGVGDYVHYELGQRGGDLPGAALDAQRMHKVLTERWGFPASQVRLLLDTDATYANIRSGLTEWLPSVVRPGDVVVFYFAGHGSQVWDQDGDEPDGLDETICPTDVMRKSSKNDIRDDQLREWLEAIPTSKVTVILDSCNSGTATRGAPWMRTRMLSREAESDLVDERQPSQVLTRSALSGAKAAEMDAPRGVLELAAAQAGESAMEGLFEGIDGGFAVEGGAFTTALVRNLWQVPVGTTYEEVFALTVEAMKQQNLAQRPQLSRIETRSGPLFEYSPRRQATAAVVGGRPSGAPINTSVAVPVGGSSSDAWPLAQGKALITALKGAARFVLGGGRAAGVLPGAAYRVGENWVIVRESESDHALVEAVTGAVGTRGIQPVANKPEGVEVGALATLEGVPLPAPSLRVSAPGIASVDREALRSELRGVAIDLLSNPGEVAHLQLQKQGPAYQILGVDGSVRHSLPRGELAAVLRRELASHRIARLDNPGQVFPLDVAFGGPSHTLRLNDVVEFRVRSGRDGYLTIVDLDPAGAATVVFPNEFDSANRITAGREIVVPTPAMSFQFRAQEPAGRGLVRVFVTDKPLQIAPSTDAVGAAEALREALLRAAGSLPLQGSTAVPVRTWGTAAVTYEILR